MKSTAPRLLLTCKYLFETAIHLVTGFQPETLVDYLGTRIATGMGFTLGHYLFYASSILLLDGLADLHVLIFFEIRTRRIHLFVTFPPALHESGVQFVAVYLRSAGRKAKSHRHGSHQEDLPHYFTPSAQH